MSSEDRPKILIIDDSSFVASATREALEQRGLDARFATSVSRANALILAWRPTVVLLDVKMPGVDGTDICRWLKERIVTTGVPVYLFSDLPESGLPELVAACGADGYVTKRKGLAFVAERVSSLCEEIVG
jgi:DNA-binding response OmpR family regulator